MTWHQVRDIGRSTGPSRAQQRRPEDGNDEKRKTNKGTMKQSVELNVRRITVRNARDAEENNERNCAVNDGGNGRRIEGDNKNNAVPDDQIQEAEEVRSTHSKNSM